LYRASLARRTEFLGVPVDVNAGGFVDAEVRKSLEICIADKTWKIGAFRAKYPEWWLVLIDHVCCGALTRSEWRHVQNWLDGKHDLNKVIVLNRNNAAPLVEASLTWKPASQSLCPD